MEGVRRQQRLRHDAHERGTPLGAQRLQPGRCRSQAATVIAYAGTDFLFGKLIANAFDREQLIRNDLTAAQVQASAMAARRDYAGSDVASNDRRNVATEQAQRSDRNQGQRDATAIIGLSVEETSRRIGFITTLSGKARSSAIPGSPAPLAQ